MAPKSCNGKVLHVDLTQRKTWIEEPSDEFYRTYGGGSAMGVYYLLKEMKPRVDALSPENILTLFLGIPTGLPISGQSRMTAAAKSPLTGAVGDSQCGGFFPAKMKQSGFDGIVIRGRAPEPVYLWLHDGEAEIRSASHLWGKVTAETEDALRAELKDDKIEVCQIGPAGELGVRYAALINMCNRANGRTGMGAVMGSKNLKAVVVQGRKRVEAARPEEVSRMFREGTRNIPNVGGVKFLSAQGTAGDVAGNNAAGALPSYNFNRGTFEYYEGITGELQTDTILTKRDTCFSCAVRCKPVISTEFRGRKVLPRYGGIEYETMAALGSYCGVHDIAAVGLANQLCNLYGIDTISCGATIAWAMECFEKGILTLDDTGGIDLHFGNADSMVKLVELIGKREGFGQLLGEGSERAARAIGRGSQACLTTSKGQEAPAHMPQFKRMMGLHYAVNPFGADHESAEHDPFVEVGVDDLSRQNMAQLGFTELQEPGSINAYKARMVAVTQWLYSAMDSYCFCVFVWGPAWQLYGPQQMAELLRYATGWDITLEEVLRVGERRVNMLRAFNMREGLDRRQDTLPPKFYEPLQGPGPREGVHYTRDEFNKLLDDYYAAMGWDVAAGNPTREKLASLGLDWIQIA